MQKPSQICGMLAITCFTGMVICTAYAVVGLGVVLGISTVLWGIVTAIAADSGK